MKRSDFIHEKVIYLPAPHVKHVDNKGNHSYKIARMQKLFKCQNARMQKLFKYATEFASDTLSKAKIQALKTPADMSKLPPGPWNDNNAL